MTSQDAVNFRPTLPGTFLILMGCAISYVISFQDIPSSHMARNVSLTWLLVIGGSFLLDWRLGLRNLIRVDVFALLSLYFFIYFEFLFTQIRFDLVTIGPDVVKAVHLTIMGLAAMVVGRHIVVGGKTLAFIGSVEMQKRDYLIIYFSCFFLWGLPMWLSVEFDMVEWYQELVKPRFSQVWGRGRYGDLSALLYELQLFGYVLPPIAGVILARRKEYGKVVYLLVIPMLLILWFVGFTSGTRNILGIQMAGFLGGFLIVQKQLKLKTVIISGSIMAVGFVVLAGMMLDFRQMGLENYIKGGYYRPETQELTGQYMGDIFHEEEDSGYFVDYNLWRISQMVEAFPGRYDHIGFNMPYVALTKPIPRAFWPGKPMDLKVGLEEAIDARGYTIAVTWIGEAYVAGGIVWVVAIGLLIGIYCRFWNQLAGYINSPFPLIVFASGFFAVLLLMRSLMFFTTALLPPIALVAFGLFLYEQRKA